MALTSKILKYVAQLFEKGSRRNLKSDFGAFNMQWSFGSKLETSTKIFVKISFFNKIH